MPTTPAFSDLDRVVFAARFFLLAGLWATLAVTHSGAYTAMLMITVTALLATLVTWSLRAQSLAVAISEGAVVGILAIAVDPTASAAIPYLAVPSLVGGLSGRLTGLFTTLGAEAAALGLTTLISPTQITQPLLGNLVLWLVAAMGTGLLGTSIHRLFAESRQTAAYRDAIDLISQLHTLSGALGEDLDVRTAAGRVLGAMGSTVPFDGAALIARNPTGEYVPVLFTSGSRPEEIAGLLGQLDQLWRTRRPWRAGNRFAVPLLRDNNVVCALIGHSATPPTSTELTAAAAAITGDILRLDAALMFGNIAASATLEERRRLAREVHDGLAQDLASLGYLIDALDPADPDLSSHIAGLRGQVTAVLREVRQSVSGLRTDLRSELSVGETVTVLAAQLEASNPFRVHVDVCETGTRLPQDAEAQLVRIAQEALNNARKHAAPENVWVNCHIAPPTARLEIRDDGIGLGARREGSHGLTIMGERAAQIGARLTMTSGADHRGTVVLVEMGGTP